mmetsp:Transcript_7372/g.22329  ORF Transcript_7372/g.22329 Transcript_7372/m.22329 type:complete len:201 (-) Transcript_7372:1202-1804(-)
MSEVVEAPTSGSVYISTAWQKPTVTTPLTASAARPVPTPVSSKPPCSTSVRAASASIAARSACDAARSAANADALAICVAHTASGELRAPAARCDAVCVSCVRTMCTLKASAEPASSNTCSGVIAAATPASPNPSLERSKPAPKNATAPASASADAPRDAPEGLSPRAASMAGEKTTESAIAHDATATDAPSAIAWLCNP